MFLGIPNTAVSFFSIANSLSNQVTPQGLPSEGSYTSYGSGDNINKIMGPAKQGLYGKNFKIRFTSKKTGKKIDLNLIFEAKIA